MEASLFPPLPLLPSRLASLLAKKLRSSFPDLEEDLVAALVSFPPHARAPCLFPLEKNSTLKKMDVLFPLFPREAILFLIVEPLGLWVVDEVSSVSLLLENRDANLFGTAIRLPCFFLF